ncbi:ricin B-like lectin EULS3 [Humulus lupulus]|uniref:ricin B-like lectin EULS3 n=1 Tax=Humulus lupulus TaxID=3486 RepID=UPI002B4041D9|nr:ricin B-like lectin EULS3 [Humulus lupulus]
MEFPYGHTTTHHHHHHRRDQDDDDDNGDDNRQRPNYPPPGTHYSSFDQPPPPPPPTSSHFPHDSPATHVHHSSHQSPYEDRSFPPPPPPSFDHRPPPFDSFDHRPEYGASTNVLHVGHHFEQPAPIEEPGFHGDHHSRPHLPSFLPHHSTNTHQGSQSELYGRRTVKVFTKAEPNYSLTIRDGKVILAKSNPSDDLQHWYKDEKYSTRVKDEEGFPCFALVNKATGQAMKHSVGATHPVQLIPYNSNVLDESILWTEGKDLGDGFRPVRMVNNIRLNVDAFHGDKHSGGVHDGTTIVLWQWNKGDNQRWRITPY